MRHPAAIAGSLLVLATAAVASDQPDESRPMRPMVQPRPGARIVNGLTTTAWPSTVALIDTATDEEFCTGTLIGCQTVLTAAHCVCDGDGSDCQEAGPDLIDPAEFNVFAQHGGFFAVTDVRVPDGYEFGVTSDVALLILAAPVNGIAPTPINTFQDPAPGTPGQIVGFGLTRGDLFDSGVKRYGWVETRTCEAVPDPTHVCWEFTAPLGAPGSDSNTCPGDSGGPLFIDFGSGDVVAGVTSGGEGDDCLPPDRSWDANVYAERAWIQAQGGADLSNTACGNLPQAGEANAAIVSGEGNLSASNAEAYFSVDVPTGASLLRVTLNGEDGSPSSRNDFELFLKAGSQPTPSDFDCSGILSGPYEACAVANPAVGTWHVLARRFAGAGAFQVTATVFKGPGQPSEPCTPSATTLCIDDQPDDGRFAIEVAFSTVQGGGQSGFGQAIPLASLGIARGGLFWFFSSDNPELLIKVLDGCSVNGYYWVFWSAGTNVGLDLTVTDTVSGATVRYLNTDGVAAPPVTDTSAFSCD